MSLCADWTSRQRLPGELGRVHAILPLQWRVRRGERGLCTQPTTLRELGGATAVAQEAVMANAMKACGQHVEQKAAEELVSGQRHHFALVVVAIIPPVKGDRALVEGDEAVIGNRHAMSIAA